MLEFKELEKNDKTNRLLKEIHVKPPRGILNKAGQDELEYGERLKLVKKEK